MYCRLKNKMTKLIIVTGFITFAVLTTGCVHQNDEIDNVITHNRLSLNTVSMDVKGDCNYGQVKDADCDGVPDAIDECPATPYLVKVNEKGCPVDSDCDGVPDHVDKCPGTAIGVQVTTEGCPFDTDGDGIADIDDQCPGTLKCLKVDNKGCPVDADCDGVPDHIDKCPDTPKGVKTDDKGCPLDSDNDGVPDFDDKCPDTPEGTKVGSNGCPDDSDGDGVPDHIDKCPETPKEARIDEQGCWILGDTLFDFNKYEIKPQYHYLLDEVVEILNSSKSVNLTIIGYTDNKGTEPYNHKLSLNRATSVMNYFINKGIQKNRLSVQGYGFHKPKGDNDTEEGRALNRRVELRPSQKTN